MDEGVINTQVDAVFTLTTRSEPLGIGSTSWILLEQMMCVSFTYHIIFRTPTVYGTLLAPSHKISFVREFFGCSLYQDRAVLGQVSPSYYLLTWNLANLSPPDSHPEGMPQQMDGDCCYSTAIPSGNRS